jgi:hypothetical protein
MPPRGDRQTPDVTLAQQEIIVLDEPRSGARHEFRVVENGRRLLAKIGHQSAFRVRGEFAASEQPECRGVVLEQGSRTPAIERPDRGNPRRRAIDLPAKMIEDLRWYQLHRVERSAGQLEKADLQGERQPVQRSAAFPDRGKLILVEREEVLDLERGQRLGEALLAEVSMLPSIDRRRFCRVGCSVWNGRAPIMQISPCADRANGVDIAVSGDSQTVVYAAKTRKTQSQRLALCEILLPNGGQGQQL